MLFHGSKTYDSSAVGHRRRHPPPAAQGGPRAATAATQTSARRRARPRSWSGSRSPRCTPTTSTCSTCPTSTTRCACSALALFVAGVITTIFGIALGRFASTRSLRPLAVVSRAARAIAGGDLDTRLDAEAADPDLEGFTFSFNAMVDQLQERIEREARFNSDVSHELRSPLTTLAASVEVLEADRDDLPLRSQRALQLLSDDLRRFQRMVADLLEMSRADAGSVDVFLEDVRWRTGAALGRDGLRPHGRSTATPHPRRCRWTRPSQAWRVGVDKRRFERVMVNLLENADHYGGGATVVGGGRGARRTARWWSSPSTTPARASTRSSAPRCSTASTAGPESGRRGTGTGNGLGLALVAEHMRVMHGAVRVESSPEGGARIVLTLPVLGTDEDDESTTPTASRARHGGR